MLRKCLRFPPPSPPSSRPWRPLPNSIKAFGPSVRIYFYLRDRYLSEEMSAAFKTLWTWYYAHRDSFVQDWLALEQTDKALYEEISAARRLVSRFYIDVARLYVNQKISRKLARMATASTGINCLYQIVLPMNEAHGTHVSKRYLRTIRKIRKRYVSGDLD
jgi:hypothetical protein